MTHPAFGGYGDWPGFMARTPRLPGDLAALFGIPEPTIGQVRQGRGTVVDGVRCVRLRWVAGFGPDNAGWLLHPADADPTDLPGVLALSSHGGIFCVGAERMVDVPGVPAHVLEYRERFEDGRAVASDLARAGFTVLAPDAFCWGARRLDLGVDDPVSYDRVAGEHEQRVAQACALFDTTLAGMVAGDDLGSLGVLRQYCAAGGLGVLGFSGGGGRAAAVAAMDPGVTSIVVIAMMCTLVSLFPDHLGHSWLLHTRGLASGPDLPGLLSTDPTRHALVGYCADDHLFPLAGMLQADAQLAEAFSGQPGSYTSVWAQAGHAFTRDLQQRAADHLSTTLAPAASAT